MLNSIHNNVKLEDTFAPIANNKNIKIRFYILIFFLVYMTCIILIESLQLFANHSLGQSIVGYFCLFSILGSYIAVRFFYKKHGRLFTQKEYKSFLKGILLIVGIVMSCLISLTAIGERLDPRFADIPSNQFYLIAVCILLFFTSLYIMIAKGGLNLIIIAAYRKALKSDVKR